MSFVYKDVCGFEWEMNEKGVGLVFFISAPSGTGKTTVVKGLMEKVSGLRFSVSYTTRLPRPCERDGEDYHFVSHAAFQKMVERKEFLEWAEVLGNCYGTPRADLKKLEAGGFDLILDIDTQGAKQASKEIDQAVLIYLVPPSLKVLRERLMNRGMDSLEMIKFRLSNARKDINEAQGYHYVIINDKIEDAVDKLKSIIIAERCRRVKDLILEESKKHWEEKNG